MTLNISVVDVKNLAEFIECKYKSFYNNINSIVMNTELLFMICNLEDNFYISFFAVGLFINGLKKTKFNSLYGIVVYIGY